MSHSRILVVGVGPIPAQGPERQLAPGLRLWGLARALAGAGIPTSIITALYFDQSSGRDPSGALSEPPLDWIAVSLDKLEQQLSGMLTDLRPRAVVAVSDLVASTVALADPPCPLWVDWYGDPMAEAQLLAAVHVHNGGLAPHAARMLAPLLRADHFSVCSRAQRYALLGELGLAGRLNAATAHHELVSVIPAMLAHELPAPHGPSPLRGPLVDSKAFVVLWTGGFNTWTDVATLVGGLERAMDEIADVHLVVLGGAIERHSVETYADFERRVAASRHRGRFHLLGWRPPQELSAFYASADVGINIDARCHEAELGTRTRLLEWIQAGLPVCSTVVCEMTRELERAGGLVGFGVGDAQGLCARIVELARNRDLGRAVARAAREYALTYWTPDKAAHELISWARDPKPAPDREPKAAGTGTNSLRRWAENLLRALRAEDSSFDEIEQMRRELEALRGSRLVKLRNLLQRLRRAPR